MDSCNGADLSGFVSYEYPGLVGTIDLDSGQCLYFQAEDAYGYVNYSSYGEISINANVLSNPDPNLIPGCTDELACNFDTVAQTDDNS